MSIEKAKLLGELCRRPQAFSRFIKNRQYELPTLYELQRFTRNPEYSLPTASYNDPEPIPQDINPTQNKMEDSQIHAEDISSTDDLKRYVRLSLNGRRIPKELEAYVARNADKMVDTYPLFLRARVVRSR